MERPVRTTTIAVSKPVPPPSTSQMASTLPVLTIVPAAVAVLIVVRARSAIWPTSLRLAWSWVLAATCAIAVVWLLTGILQCVPSPWDDRLWYAIAELALCPLIAVLGARRPGVAVWNWFVLLPLLVVLGWPVAAAILSGDRSEIFNIETPQTIGFVLVLIMGAGNYLGTRWTVPIVAWTFAFWLALNSVWRSNPDTVRMLAVWCVGLAAVLGWWCAHRPNKLPIGPQRVWRDFGDQFGIVWAQRIRERINERAAQEKWPVRLERSGFVQIGGEPANNAELADPRIEQALRWLLRRFVDDVWLDERLGTTNRLSGASPE